MIKRLLIVVLFGASFFVPHNFSDAQTSGCFVDTISWGATQAVVGTPISLKVRMSNPGCAGKTIHVDIWDADTLGGCEDPNATFCFDDPLGSSDPILSGGSGQDFTITYTLTAGMYAIGDDFGEGSKEEIYFTAYGEEGKTFYKTSNIIPFYPVAPPTASITCNGGAFCNIFPGGSATLAWNSTGATSCSLSPGGSVALTGSTSVSPSSSTTYTLTCGSASASTVVSVIQATAPRIDNFDVSPRSIPPTASAVDLKLTANQTDSNFTCPSGYLDWIVWYEAAPGGTTFAFRGAYNDGRGTTYSRLPLSPNPLNLDFSISNFIPNALVANQGYAFFHAGLGCSIDSTKLTSRGGLLAVSSPVCVTIAGGTGNCASPGGQGVNINNFDLNPKPYCSSLSTLNFQMTLRGVIDIAQISSTCGSTTSSFDWYVYHDDNNLLQDSKISQGTYSFSRSGTTVNFDASKAISYSLGNLRFTGTHQFYAEVYCPGSYTILGRITKSSPVSVTFDTSSCPAPPLPPPPPPPPRPVEGQFVWNIGGNPFVGGDNLICVINWLSVWIFNISVPIFVLMILYAGLMFLTSKGDTGKVQTARKILWYAILGIAIVLIARGFVSLIVSILGGQAGTNFTC